MIDAPRLAAALRGAICHGPVPESEVEKAERELAVEFPPSFRLFLTNYGAAYGAGPELAGVPLSDRVEPHRTPEWMDLVVLNQRSSLPKNYLEISDDGQDCRYLLDLSAPDKDGECPVVAFGPGRDFEFVAPSFLHFVERRASANEG